MIKRLKHNLLNLTKNKTKFFTLVLIFIVFAFYCLGYLHYRKHLYLIHRKFWTNDRKIHRITRGRINEKHLLIMMLNGKNTNEVIEAGKKVENKIEVIYYFYYPCSLSEEIFWQIID